MIPRNRGSILTLCLSVLVGFSIVAYISSRGFGSTTQWFPNSESKAQAPCPNNVEWLSSLNIAYPIRYSRRDIVVAPRGDVVRSRLTKVKENLMPDFETIDLSKDSTLELKHCMEPLVLEIPKYSEDPVDASHIMFGISTTLKRLEQSIPQLLRWLPHTKARLFVIVVKSEDFQDIEKTVFATSTEKNAVQSTMRDLGMDVTIVDPLEKKDVFAEKYFSLIKLMHSRADKRTIWVSAIDDDTFIPSMPALIAMLAKYDGNKQFYIGALSENWSAVTRYGLMAFGGAGIFISRPLSQIISNHYETCKHTSGSNAGDIRIMECIYRFTSTKLTIERDLHQVDVWGDISGIFESGQSLLSLHHWKPGDLGLGGWPLPLMHTVADVCKECFLQRWQFGPDTILSNGFSISYYPRGHLNKVDINLIEDTWDPIPPVEFSIHRDAGHSFGPSRPKLPLDQDKIQFRLVASAAVDGGVRQAYHHPGVNGEMDSLLELFWRTAEQTDLE